MKQNKDREELREKLADIEHQRWSDWMSYLFKRCGCPKNGEDAVIPAEWADRWGIQMNTDYSELTEKEKDSDREQVDRYLDLVESYTKKKVEEALKKVDFKQVSNPLEEEKYESDKGY